MCRTADRPRAVKDVNVTTRTTSPVTGGVDHETGPDIHPDVSRRGQGPVGAWRQDQVPGQDRRGRAGCPVADLLRRHATDSNPAVRQAHWTRPEQSNVSGPVAPHRYGFPRCASASVTARRAGGDVPGGRVNPAGRPKASWGPGGGKSDVGAAASVRRGRRADPGQDGGSRGQAERGSWPRRFPSSDWRCWGCRRRRTSEPAERPPMEGSCATQVERAGHRGSDSSRWSDRGAELRCPSPLAAGRCRASHGRSRRPAPESLPLRAPSRFRGTADSTRRCPP